jgi:hypothetical protein
MSSPETFRFHTTKFETAQERAAAAALPAAERQWMAENLLFEYKLFKSVSEEISRFHRPVAGGTHGKGTIGGLLGEPRAGKSYICQHYFSRFPLQTTEEGEQYPVIYLEARDDWTVFHAAEQIFMQTGAKSLPSLKRPAMITAALRRLLKARTELVIIDDAHFLLLEAKGTRLAGFKSIVKAIADLRSCNVLLAGLAGLQPLVENDGQLLGRGDFPHWEMLPLRWEIEDEREQFTLLLHGIDQRLPFRNLSNLSEAEIVADFYHATGGIIGRVMNLICDAALRAINDQTSAIMDYHLEAAAKPRMKAGETYIPFRRGRAGNAA